MIRRQALAPSPGRPAAPCGQLSPAAADSARTTPSFPVRRFVIPMAARADVILVDVAMGMGPQARCQQDWSPITGDNRGELMAGEKSQNVQDVFLNHIRKNKMPVTIFLVNGVKLQGIVTWFDNFSVLLRRDAHSQLVYKHAISTVMPAGPVQLFEGTKEGEEA
jgi:host factor-I protein